MGSILSKIKQGVKQSGENKGKVVYFRPDTKTRLRFLSDIEDAVMVKMHDSFDRGINAVCREHYGEECPYCDDNDLRHREAFVFSVWDAEAKEVKLFVGYANNFNPLPSLTSMYESYGTLKDRDYIISREGSQTNTRYGVVPMDKVKFKNTKAKPFSEKKVMEILGKAFPVNDEDLEDQDDDENIEDDDNYENDEEEYEDMSPKELYMECIERGIKVRKKKPKDYYIEKLEEFDEENEDDEDDDDEEW